ncbi:MAG: helix-turn-helix domain-containing protein [bacterium]
MNEAVNNLMHFGFTKLEAEIYLALLEEETSTGYRLAQILNKPIPNVYKALNTLKNKKAIICDDSIKTQLYAAIPIKELLIDKKNEFISISNTLEEQLKQYENKKNDDGIHRLTKYDDVINRAKKMIEEADEILLIDIWPKILEMLKNEIVAAGKRGVTVIVKTYIPTELQNCEVTYCSADNLLIDKFKGQWLNVVTAKEYLVSFVDMDKQSSNEAFWSKNIFLSLLMYNGFSQEFILTGIRRKLEENKSIEELMEIFKNYETLRASNSKVFKMFMDRLNK